MPLNLLTTYPKGFWILGGCISYVPRVPKLYTRPWTLRKGEYQGIMDICKNMSYPKLSGPGCMVT